MSGIQAQRRLDQPAGITYAVNLSSGELRVISMNQTKVNATINEVCHDGCDAVNAVINALEHDQPLPAVKDLNPSERQALLQELKQIMAVYNR